MRATTTRGFTLIELSIVLVIIGLIVGGVLVGRDLILAAELRKATSAHETVRTAVNTFRLKYNGLPGDLLHPENFGFQAYTNHPGSATMIRGDGVIRSAGCYAHGAGHHLCVSSSSGEPTYFWLHLVYSGLLESSIKHADYLAAGSYGCPNNAISNGSPLDNIFHKIKRDTYMAVYALSGRQFYEIHGNTTAGSSCQQVRYDALTPHEAQAIDVKIDDGDPRGGSIIATSRGNGTQVVMTSANGHSHMGKPANSPCVVSDEYNVTNETNACALRLDF